MKLIGSRSEEQLREELVRSNLALRDGSYGLRLTALLKSVNVNLADAYVLQWIPEQGEDIYTLLVSSSEVLIVEIPRGKGEGQLDRQSLVAYSARCSKHHRLKIAVAQDLIVGRGSDISH